MHLTVLDGDAALYVDCYESSKRLRTYSVIGIRGPLYCTAVGKAILAFLDDDQQIRLINRMTFRQFTAKTHTGADSLKTDLAAIRKRGYSVDDVEHEEGVRCVGSPIYDNRGRVCASLSISGPTQRITRDAAGELARQAVATAREISRKLGYRSVS